MIGERLFDLRKDANLTQDELSNILKINKHSISSYERDKSEPPDTIKIAIAKYFNVSIDYLLGITKEPTPITVSMDYLRLPHNFPFEAKKELLRFADYLKKYYKEDIPKEKE